MANDFRTQTLILGDQYLTTTGNTLYISGVPVVTGYANIGVGSGIVSGSYSGIFNFKTLIGGSGIQISGNPANNSLTLLVTGINGGGTTTTATNIGGQTGIYSGVIGSQLQFKTLIGGSGVQISGNAADNTLTFIVTGITGGSTAGIVGYDVPTARYFV